MIVTFYSYKGGVGRTLALANVACLLGEDAEHPQRVLVWDFDLEAPALYGLFPPKEPRRHGFVDLAYEFAQTDVFPSLEDYIYTSDVPGVDVLPAGKLGDSYCEKLQRIDWLKFFGSDPTNPGPFFGQLLQEFGGDQSPYDYVLIDSRTGLNDQAGITTQVLSDVLVILFRLTDQNLQGLDYLVPTMKALAESRKKIVEFLPVASQVGSAAARGMLENRDRAVAMFGRELEYIRFDEELAGKDELLCLREKQTSMWPRPPIVDDYERLCRIIRNRNVSDTRTQTQDLQNRVREGDAATAWHMALDLIRRRPRLQEAWNVLSTLPPVPEARREKSAEIVRKVLLSDSTNPHAYLWKAEYALVQASAPDSQEVHSAREWLLKAYEHASGIQKHRSCVLLSSVYSCLGDLEEAVEWLRRARESMPENVQMLLDLADLHIRMGAAYWGTAVEELERVPPEVQELRSVPLVYLRAFLGHKERAEKELEQCGSLTEIAECHMRLILDQKEEALGLAEQRAASCDDPGDLRNWIEFFLCAEEFARASSLAKELSEVYGYVSGTAAALDLLAQFLRGHKTAPKMQEVIDAWRNVRRWGFRELLLFRERCRRDDGNYGDRLDVVEQLVRWGALRSLLRAEETRGWLEPSVWSRRERIVATRTGKTETLVTGPTGNRLAEKMVED